MPRAATLPLKAALVTLALMAAKPAAAATFTVTNTLDSGPGSLRQAVLDANALAGADLIVFDAVAFSAPQTITLTAGEMLITDGLTIDGPSAALTISGSNISRHFNINGPGALTLILRDLRLTAGRASGLNEGGSIFIQDEHVTLENCMFQGNSSNDAAGAVQIEAAGAALLINRCSFVTNLAATAGGAIATDGPINLTILESTFSGNMAVAGGAINHSVGGSLLVLNSSLSGNTATSADGGAIFLNSTFTSAILRNSTLSGNGASLYGGGATIGIAFNGTLTVQNCTIAGNSAGQNGGGLARRTGSVAAINLTSSILWNNTATNGPSIYTTGTVNASACMVGSIAGITTFLPDAFTLAHVGVNPSLGPLQNNGGTTLTHALLAGSQAIDSGSNPETLATDQRSTGFARVVQGSCAGPLAADIGAFEVQALPPDCPGACCFANGSCSTLSAAACAAAGGTHQGAGAACNSPPCAVTCGSDIAPAPNGDGETDVNDLLAVINAWGACPAPCPPRCAADIAPAPPAAGDCAVNVDDLLGVINAWGPCP